MKRNYYIVPTKNKRTGELLEIKVYLTLRDALDDTMSNPEERVSNGKFIEKPILGAYAETEEEAIRLCQEIFPEHATDSQELLKLFKKCLKEEN